MAAKLQCEICGGKLIGRPGGVFECDSCGMEYDTAWAKEKIQEITGTVKVEGTVEITGKVQVDGPVKVEGGVNKEALLKRGRLALEDGEWDKAKAFFDQALTLDAEYADAWLGLAMAKLKLKNESGFAGLEKGFASVEGNADYQKFVRFASPERMQEVSVHLDAAEAEKQRREAERKAQENADAAARAAFREKLPTLRARIAPAQGLIAAGHYFTVGLKPDGTVITVGSNVEKQCDVTDWCDIVQIAAQGCYTVGLKSDGTVVSVGANSDGACNVSDWRDIIAICSGGFHTVGLKSDGTVVAVGKNDEKQCDVSDWKDIVAVAAAYNHTVGLKADGTVVAAGANGYIKSYNYKWVEQGQCNVSEWRDIVAIAAGHSFTAGLKSDGTVVVTGAGAGESDFSGWRDIIAITTDCFSGVIGLKSDGTVIYNQRRHDFSEWRDIVAISGNNSHVIALKSDGTVLAAGANTCGECDITQWKLFDRIETLPAERRMAMETAKAERRVAAQKAEAERKAAAAKAEAERKAKIVSLEAERAALSEELKNLKGLFTGKRRKEIEARLDEISSELEKLG